MKVLLVMPSFNYGGRYIMTLGIMYVSAYLKREGFSVDALNLNHYGPGKLAEVLRRERYDVVATGGLFAFYVQFRCLIATVRRESPSARVVLGGAVASAHPEFALESLGPDYLVLGEGELPMAGLLRALERGQDPSGVPGLAFRRDGVLLSTPPAPPIPDLDALPWPDYEGFEFSRYLEAFSFVPDQVTVSRHAVRRIAPMIAGRGCPAKCTFCYQLIEHYRQRSVPAVLAELRHLKERYRITEAEFLDETFASTKERLLEFCAQARALDMEWGCQMRVPTATRETLRAMKDAGCTHVSYGLESASPEVLRSMRKGISIAKAEEALALTREAELGILAQLIFGDPAETMATAEISLEFYRRHRADFGSNIELSPLIPYPGSVVYRDLVRQGRLRDLRRFYETHRNESGRFINMTAMPDHDFYRLIYEILPAEERATARACTGRVSRSRRLGPGAYEITFTCPLCGRTSDGLRVRVSTDFPMKTFRVTCPRCRQRGYADRLGTLGAWGLAVFLTQARLREAYERFKTTRLFAAVRYHPAVDAAWDAYKVSHFSSQELSAWGAVRARLGFAGQVAWLLLSRSGRRL